MRAGPHDRRDRTRYWIDSRTYHVVRITWKGQTLATYDWQRATPERLRGLWPPLPAGATGVR